MKDLGWLYSKNTFFAKNFVLIYFPQLQKKHQKRSMSSSAITKGLHFQFVCGYMCVCFQIMLMCYVASQSQGRKTFIEIMENQRGGRSSGTFPVEDTGFILLNNMAKSQQQIHSNIIILSGPLASFPSHHSLLIEIFFKIKF